MPLVLEEATRTGIVPLVGVYGKSGSGKTHSALLLALGLAGDKEVAIVDTENRRSGIIVDLLPRKVRRINLEPPFTPERYIEAIELLVSKGIGCGVVDSMSHEWSGEGGILEWQEKELQRMAGDDYKRREACKMAAWIQPKMGHKALVKYILRCPIPLVCCLRADEKTHIDKKDGEKTRVITDEFTTPDYDKKFIFEMLCNLETITVDRKPGCARVTKWSHPDVLNLLPKEGEQITEAHGRALANWCLMKSGPAPAPVAKTTPAMLALKRELWQLTDHYHHGEVSHLEQWLWDEAIMDPGMRINDATEAQLRAFLAVVKKKLKK